jgi:hypothetical protein
MASMRWHRCLIACPSDYRLDLRGVSLIRSAGIDGRWCIATAIPQVLAKGCGLVSMMPCATHCRHHRGNLPVARPGQHPNPELGPVDLPASFAHLPNASADYHEWWAMICCATTTRPSTRWRAASRTPRLAMLRHDPDAPHLVLVGKGVCFDTGGLDLKTADGMR